MPNDSTPVPKRWWLWIPPAVFATLLFALSSLPGSAFAFGFVISDKLLHGCAYAVLGILLAVPLHHNHGASSPSWRLTTIAVVIATLYGLTDEVHQAFTPHRTPDVFDLLADSVGAFLGAFTYAYIKRRRHRNR